MREIRTINVGQLDEIAFHTREAAKEGERMVIDLAKLGYDKLLGRGGVLNPYVVKVPSFSERAREKVEAAGGEIVGLS